MSDMVTKARDAMIATHSIRQAGAAPWPSDFLDKHERMARAALLAALDPEDEALVERVAQKLWDDDEPADHGFWRAKVKQALFALSDTTQGEQG